MQEGCDHWFVFTMYNPECTVVHVRHLRLSLRLCVRRLRFVNCVNKKKYLIKITGLCSSDTVDGIVRKLDHRENLLRYSEFCGQNL